MNRLSFRELLSRARDNPETYNPLFEMVREGRVSEDEIYDALVETVASRSWRVVGLLVSFTVTIEDRTAAGLRERRRFAPLLAQVLDEACELVNNEDIVELLGDIQDECSISALQRAVAREFPANTDWWANRKALEALARFDDPRAWETIREALKSPHVLIREEAQSLLGMPQSADD